MAQNMFLFPLDIMGGDFTLPVGQALPWRQLLPGKEFL